MKQTREISNVAGDCIAQNLVLLKRERRKIITRLHQTYTRERYISINVSVTTQKEKEDTLILTKEQTIVNGVMKILEYTIKILTNNKDMKSEKAKKLIGNKSNRADEYYGQVKVIRNDYAEKAVEIAEQEIDELVFCLKQLLELHLKAGDDEHGDQHDKSIDEILAILDNCRKLILKYENNKN